MTFEAVCAFYDEQGIDSNGLEPYPKTSENRVRDFK